MGQSFSINIGGVAGTLTGRITGFYPELSALPASLTRFFWQQETWSQYAPARLDFDEMSATQKSKLVAWAQLSASRTQDGLPALAAELWHSAPSRWVRQLVASARRNILSMSAATEVRN